MDWEERRNAKKDEILEAALDAVHEDKISGLRLRSIAQRAGMSQGHLNYYFPSKEELLLSVLGYLAEFFIRERKALLADDTQDAMAKFSVFFDQIRGLIHRKRETDVFIDFWVHALKEPRVRAEMGVMYDRWRSDIAAVISAGVEAGIFSPRHARLAPVLLVSLLEGAELQYRMDDQCFDPEEYLATAQALLLGLLSPDR